MFHFYESGFYFLITLFLVIGIVIKGIENNQR